MLQDVSRHFSTELSEVAEEEYPRNPVGRETIDTIRDYTAKATRSRSGKNLHSFCDQVQRQPKGNLLGPLYR